MIEFLQSFTSAPDVRVDVVEDGDVLRWSVANDGDAAVPVDRVGLRWRVHRTLVHMFGNGYQSWSASGGLAPDARDPSCHPDAPNLIRAMFHADGAPAAADERRSELVTALSDGERSVVLGFDGGDRHDGTFRLAGDMLTAEAYLGGAVLAPGERRELHAVRVRAGDPSAELDDWARWAGDASSARVAAPYQVGWCSWYHYFERITETAFRDNLGRAGDWPFAVVQLDDGYQSAIGDWLTLDDAFPSSLDALAGDVAAAGCTPGLWLAPFLAASHADVVREHPDWLLRRASGRPAIGNVNPTWGEHIGVLDTTRPDVLHHLERVARELVAMGWTYLKLDFTYAPALDGQWHDKTLTPAQRVRQAYDAIRRGAGSDAFLLGCGAPLGPCIGVVDGMRIGPDVAPRWDVGGAVPGYAGTAPATKNAWRNTLARAFMHRRLWLNDPDCLMLRTTDTELTEAQVRLWADTVAKSGGMAIVSDDLGLLDTAAHRLFDDTVAVGRQVDSAAIDGPAPRWPEADASRFAGPQ